METFIFIIRILSLIAVGYLLAHLEIWYRIYRHKKMIDKIMTDARGKPKDYYDIKVG